jgi:PP-loop superfamily ATP-utilizing enzyme
MPDTVPGISFDNNGLCSLCQNYKKIEYLGESALDEFLEPIRAKENKYDCIVPISGGRDSTYVLYYAKVNLGLNPLPVHNNNEFRVDQALENIKNACSRLGLEFIEFRSKRNIAQKIVRSQIKFSIPHGLPEVINGMCNACALGYRSIVYKTAEEENVPLIVWGSSKMEESEAIVGKALAEVQKRISSTVSKSRFAKLTNINYYKTNLYSLMQRAELHVPGNSVLFDSAPTLKNENIRQISLFDYIPWERETIKNTIINELGWKKPEDHVSTWRTDCRLHPLVNYAFLNTLGCTKGCFGYCNMINNGQMTREEALTQEEAISPEYTDELHTLLTDIIGLTRNEIEIIKSLRAT